MLDHAENAYLACAKDNQPYVVPIRIDVADGFIYAYSMEGQKVEFMRQNPLVCLMMNDVKTRREWRSVIVYGRYEELPNAWDYQDSRRIAERLFQKHPMWWEPATVPLPAHRRQRPVVFCIHIDRISGRRATPGAEEQIPEVSAIPQPERLGISLLRRVIGKHRRIREQ